jgi:hypothetical protein
MKLKLLCGLLLLLAFAAGCSKQYTPPRPSSSLQGTFKGQFMFIHQPAHSTTLDTLTANIQLVMQANSTFQVTGDTSKLHAGSFGSFVPGSNSSIQFFDNTYPASGTPAKIHLSGVYQYTYDGLYLRLAGYGPLDTVAYKYVLQKN